MDDAEEIKRRKIEELKRQYQGEIESQVQQEAQMQQQVEALESIVRLKLTKEALQRYGNIKAADPERAVQLLLVLAQFIQKTNVSKINESQFKEILARILPGKKEIRIMRK